MQRLALISGCGVLFSPVEGHGLQKNSSEILFFMSLKFDHRVFINDDCNVLF
jgi:hypothetical protein